ncbi:hypothetical protein D9619_002098 [Psilocybe cf. subviscida]|uniref:Uncharacterized protein n=1 Tax=Psilocybe cf. subviscida TaxID=2480587 RepID=A0A8H5F3E3_9AGAR|nr:hypothetical protein D9619_002098 [Psilocybe cf. subviscida]
MSFPYSRSQVPQESGSSNVSTSFAGKARRHRLPPAASQILEDYIQMPEFRENNPTGMPPKAAREQLLADIKKLPGTEFYKMMNLSNWFRYRQPLEHERENSQDARATSASVSTSEGQTSNTRYHSLSTNAITSLSTLCKDTANPSLDTISLWAKFLRHETPGVTLEDVNRFVNDCHNSGPNARGNVDSGLPTPGNTASPTIIPSRSMCTTPDPFSIKTRHSQSPTRGGSAPTSISASGSVAGSASPCIQPRTPIKPLGVSRPLMDDMDVDRYTPVAAGRRTSSEHPNQTSTQTNEPLLSPSPQSRSQSRSPVSTPQTLMQMMDPVANGNPPAPKSAPPPLPPPALAAQLEQDEDDDMDTSASPSSASVVVPLSAIERVTPSAPILKGTDSGILQAILQGLASVRDNTVPMTPAVACPTNMAEFEAAFARFDSTCMMIGEMLNTREAHES